jgi:hypothetical protein
MGESTAPRSDCQGGRGVMRGHWISTRTTPGQARVLAVRLWAYEFRREAIVKMLINRSIDIDLTVAVFDRVVG